MLVCVYIINAPISYVQAYKCTLLLKECQIYLRSKPINMKL